MLGGLLGEAVMLRARAMHRRRQVRVPARLDGRELLDVRVVVLWAREVHGRRGVRLLGRVVWRELLDVRHRAVWGVVMLGGLLCFGVVLRARAMLRSGGVLVPARLVW